MEEHKNSGVFSEDQIFEFIDNYIDSVEQLSVLLLLHSSPDRAWTLDEITMRLRSSDISIQKRLDDLYKKNVLEKLPELPGHHIFRPYSPEIGIMVQQISKINQIKPYKIIECIYARPEKSLRAFANAFKIKRP